MNQPRPLSILDFVRYLCPACITRGGVIQSPHWPGDVFAVCAAVLEKSGAYSTLGTTVWPARNWKSLARRTAELRRLAGDWRRQWSPDSPNCPERVREWWGMAFATPDIDLADVRGENQRIQALFDLVAVADEALAGVGLLAPDERKTQGDESAFWDHAEIKLLLPFKAGTGDAKENPHGSTLCDWIHPSRIRVLPKSQTPESGISLRSLSHHVAFCPPSDIRVSWYGYGFEPGFLREDFLNALLIPWPFEVTPRQFERIPHGRNSLPYLPEHTGWFKYQPTDGSSGSLLKIVETCLAEASAKVGKVHMIIMPELALSKQQYSAIRVLLDETDVVFVAGVVDEDAGRCWATNSAVLSYRTPVISSLIVYEQQKHHRWRLDDNQIIRYDVGASLSPEKDWWEGIDVSQRSINFVRIRDWLSTCVLICEDLARMDPVGRLVRAVGPDLVIALLMDGPQLSNRWPAHYATILADDPGSAVLTLTSLGMTRISQPADKIGKPVPRVIAMWRDPVSGTIPIELPQNTNAAVLTICKKFTPEATADGRDHHLHLGAPVFGGIHFLAARVE